MSDDNKQGGAEPSPASAGSVRPGQLNCIRMSLGEFASAIESQIRTLPVREASRPTLTNEEREALAAAREICASHDNDKSCGQIAAAIDDLMERLGGER